MNDEFRYSELRELLKEETAVNKTAKKILLDRLKENPKEFTEKELANIVDSTTKTRMEIINNMQK